MTGSMTSMRRILSVSAAVGVVLIIIWYVALFRPQSKHLSAAHRTYTSTEQHASQLKSQVQSLTALERQIPADKKRLATLNAALPSTPDLRDLLDQLHAVAVSTGVELTSVNPSLPASNASSGSGTSASGASGGTQTLQLSVSVSGTYGQLMAFVTGLDNMPRTAVVDNVSVSGSGAGKLSTTMTIRTFYAS